jgi:hypothetical protein
MSTTVVNIRTKKCTTYIGRSNDSMHFGNPFGIKKSKFSVIAVGSLSEALMAFNDWLDGSRFSDVEPERRRWILDNLETLRNQTLGCFCKPSACHGDIYRVKLGELSLADAIDQPAEEPSAPQLDLF